MKYCIHHNKDKDFSLTHHSERWHFFTISHKDKHILYVYFPEDWWLGGGIW